MKKNLWLLSFIMAIMFMMAGANFASAYTLVATDIAGSTKVDIETGLGGTDPGMTNWFVGENSTTNQLFEQWFWFRLSTEQEYNPQDQTGVMSTKLGVGADSIVETTIIDTALPVPNADNEIGNNLKIVYTYGDLQIKTSFLIDGGNNPPYGHINEVIQFRNTGTESISLRFYEYNDFDLVGTLGGDSVYVEGPSSIVQFEGNAAISEVSALDPTAYQAGLIAPIWAAVINGTTLNNTPAPGIGNAVSGGDVAFAFMWDFTFGPGGGITISKDKRVVTPVPTALLLFGSGLFSLIGVGIRRRKS